MERKLKVSQALRSFYSVDDDSCLICLFMILAWEGLRLAISWRTLNTTCNLLHSSVPHFVFFLSKCLALKGFSWIFDYMLSMLFLFIYCPKIHRCSSFRWAQFWFQREVFIKYFKTNFLFGDCWKFSLNLRKKFPNTKNFYLSRQSIYGSQNYRGLDNYRRLIELFYNR